MSGHTEPTSNTNSMKFTPMPMSALMANLVSLQCKDNVDDSNCTSEDDDQDSFSSETVSKKPLVEQSNKILSPAKLQKKNVTSTPKPYIQSYDRKLFESEKKCVPKNNDKENCEQSLPNRTYPYKDSQKCSYPDSETKKRAVLVPHQFSNTKNAELTYKSSPNVRKVPLSSQKPKIGTPKVATPKIKSGIRKYTPGSARRSQKKTPLKAIPDSNSNKESVRCLFPNSQSRGEPPSYVHNQPQHQQSAKAVPETPLNRKALPISYVATPSYPQGVIGHSRLTFKSICIKGKNYMYIKKLGTGGSSEVFKVLEVSTSCEYAVKCVDLATDTELAHGYINEVKMLRDLQNSDRVIKLYNYEYDRSNQLLRVVLEAGETDLSSFLKSRSAGLQPALVLHYWEEMLHAVDYIHQNGVIHADLKPANFLLVCGKLKLIDFGIATAISSDATSVVRAQATGTYSYISPEALMGGAGGYARGDDDNTPIKISFRSDVWSLGCILYSMVYGRTPFSHIPNLAKLAAILDPNHRIDYPPADHMPPTLIAAMKWCLTYNAKARPSVRELLGLPYLRAARAPLPPALLRKLQPLVTPDEFRLLQRAQL